MTPASGVWRPNTCDQFEMNILGNDFVSPLGLAVRYEPCNQ